jgi:hypothetical protein
MTVTFEISKGPSREYVFGQLGDIGRTSPRRLEFRVRDAFGLVGHVRCELRGIEFLDDSGERFHLYGRFVAMRGGGQIGAEVARLAKGELIRFTYNTHLREGVINFEQE